jgi:hypothetical protein
MALPLLRLSGGMTEAMEGQGRDTIDRLTFRYADRVVRLLGALYQRPRLGDRPRTLNETDGTWASASDRRERQGRQGLPMVNLIRPDGPATVLPAIATLLAGAQPGGVRHGYVALPDGVTVDPGADVELVRARDVPVIRQILLNARHELINSPKVTDSQPRFPLFSLVVFLMNNRRQSEDVNLEFALLRDLQELGFYWRIRNVTDAVNKEISDQKLRWRVLVLLIQGLTWVFFRLAVTGRIPVLSGRYRWFLRQPHLAPEMSGTFVRFATRLTDGEWQKEAPEYVAPVIGEHVPGRPAPRLPVAAVADPAQTPDDLSGAVAGRCHPRQWRLCAVAVDQRCAQSGRAVRSAAAGHVQRRRPAHRHHQHADRR